MNETKLREELFSMSKEELVDFAVDISAGLTHAKEILDLIPVQCCVFHQKEWIKLSIAKETVFLN